MEKTINAVVSFDAILNEQELSILRGGAASMISAEEVPSESGDGFEMEKKGLLSLMMYY